LLHKKNAFILKIQIVLYVSPNNIFGLFFVRHFLAFGLTFLTSESSKCGFLQKETSRSNTSRSPIMP